MCCDITDHYEHYEDLWVIKEKFLGIDLGNLLNYRDIYVTGFEIQLGMNGRWMKPYANRLVS